MKFKVGNGQEILLWLDDWHPKGPLLSPYDGLIFESMGFTSEDIDLLQFLYCCLLPEVLLPGIWSLRHSGFITMVLLLHPLGLVMRASSSGFGVVVRVGD